MVDLINSCLAAGVEITSLRSVVVMMSMTVLIGVVFVRSLRRKENGTVPPGNHFLPIKDILYLAKVEGDMVAQRKVWRQKFGDTFASYTPNILATGKLYPLFRKTIVITNASEQTEIMRKERALGLKPSLPPSLAELHGPYDMQLLEGDRHNRLRKLFSSAISPRAMDGYTPVLIEEAHRCWSILSAATEPVEVSNVIQTGLFRMMARLLYGMSVDDSQDIEDMSMLQKAFATQIEGIFNPSVFKEAKAASNVIMKWISEKVATKIAQYQADSSTDESACKTILDNAVLALVKQRKDERIDEDDKLAVICNLNVLLEASYHTTAQTITSMLYMLSQHPEELQKMREELHSLPATFSLEVSNRMIFTHGVMKETLRLMPIVPAVVFSLPAGKSFTTSIGGFIVEGPCDVLMDTGDTGPHGVNTDVFENTQRFNPSRWEQAESLKAKSAFSPFGWGSHACLGRPLAFLDSCAMMFAFFKENDLQLTPAEPPTVKWAAFPAASVKFTLAPQGPIGQS